MPEFSRTFMQTLRNESNDTEKHEKFIKTQYHLTRICSTCFFHGLTQRWRGVLHQNFESLYLEYWKRYQEAVFKN